MNEKSPQFDFSKPEDQERFSALKPEERTELINKQQGEANLFEQRMGRYLSLQMLSAQLYAMAGESEKAEDVFKSMAERRKTAVEAYESRAKSVLVNVAEYLAKGAYSSSPYRVGIERGFWWARCFCCWGDIGWPYWRFLYSPDMDMRSFQIRCG